MYVVQNFTFVGKGHRRKIFNAENFAICVIMQCQYYDIRLAVHLYNNTGTSHRDNYS